MRGIYLILFGLSVVNGATLLMVMGIYDKVNRR